MVLSVGDNTNGEFTLEPIEPSLEDVFIHLIEQQFTLTPDPSPKSGRGGLITE